MKTIKGVKDIFRKPTPLERAAKEYGEIEHGLLDIGAEIKWAHKRKEYYIERRAELLEIMKGEVV